MSGWTPQLELRLGRGLGRVKHIDTVFLWVQAMVTEGKISLGKKPTKEMFADFFAKHVDAATMLKDFESLNSESDWWTLRLALRFQSSLCFFLTA